MITMSELSDCFLDFCGSLIFVGLRGARSSCWGIFFDLLGLIVFI